MEPITHRLSSTALQPPGNTIPSATWRVGQLLQALSLGPGEPGHVTLKIGDGLFRALVAQTPAKGEQLMLRVVELGRTPVLQVVGTSPAREAIAASQRQELPRQHSLAPLMGALTSVVHQQAVKVAPQLMPHIRQLHDQLPEASRLKNPKDIRKALLDSGIFLEVKLARATKNHIPPLLAGDLKANLLALYRALSQSVAQRETYSRTSGRMTAEASVSPPMQHSIPQPQARLAMTILATLSTEEMDAELLRQVEAVLARLRLHQLASLPSADAQHAQWLAEIPLRHGKGIDILHVRIEREPVEHADKPGQTRWSIQFAIDLERLGAVHARLSNSGAKVETALWVENPRTFSLMQSFLEVLRAQFEQANIELGHLALHHGKPPSPQRSEQCSRVLDEEA